MQDSDRGHTELKWQDVAGRSDNKGRAGNQIPAAGEHGVRACAWRAQKEARQREGRVVRGTSQNELALGRRMSSVAASRWASCHSSGVISATTGLSKGMAGLAADAAAAGAEEEAAAAAAAAAAVGEGTTGNGDDGRAPV